ncbi:MAG: hypothetical protein KF760_05695 [Candidatus Eremiobacteraeota bacterium]|nr:hypothetical protein [Candidatus Eremiobacteraeota bacterium]
MQQCEHQQIQQNPFPNQACAMNMNFGAQRINGCCNSFMGQPYGSPFGGGPISNFAMAGAGPGGSFAFAGNNGLGGGFNNLFSSPLGGGNSAYAAGFQAGLSGGAFNNGFNSGFNGGFNGGGFGNGLGFGSPFAGGLPFGGQNLNLSLGISLNV